MAYTAIDDPSAHFHIQLYTGDGEASLAITNDANAGDFSPDWLWVKNRTSGGGTGPHYVLDTTRGNTKDVNTNAAEAEHTESTVLLSFDIDGFSVGSAGVVNNDTDSFVAWQWKANGGSRTTNAEDGNNPAGGYQANTTAGFSIVDYTGTGAAGTMAHGLGAAPDFIMIKNRDEADDWAVYHSANTAAPETDYLVLNETDATADDATYWNDTAPTSSVFTVATAHNVNADAEKYMAYCFTSIQGYSKFGSYTGNGDADGTFVYTGFRPKYVMWRRSNDSGGWTIWDDARDSDNEMDKYFYANTTSSEYSGEALRLDFLSNGFKHRHSNSWGNGSDDTYIYIAFAEQPFVTSGGVPCTAR
jgi:hypothetical protein